MFDEAFGYNTHVPENIREILMWLCQDVLSLHNKWSLYLGLFRAEDDRYLLSELALGSFNIIEESLRFDMTMSIRRLSDPPGRGKRKNLSLQTLAEKCDDIDNVGELLERFLAACEPVRRLSDKRVAHRDLSTTIKADENPLPGIAEKRIDQIVELAARILNLIYRNFDDKELAFQPSLIGGADALLYWLRLAKRAKKDQEDRFRASAG